MLGVTTIPRSHLIDAMKGFTILLVVMGNYMQLNTPYFYNHVIFRVVYSFELPLFFFLSGYLAKPGSSTYLKNKFIGLIIPFLGWHALNYIILHKYISSNFQMFMVEGIMLPGLGLWFLWALFLCHGALWLCLKGEERFGKYALLLGVIVIEAMHLKDNYFGLLYLKEYFPFLMAGYLTCKYKASVMKYKGVLIAAAVVCFPLLAALPWPQPSGHFSFLQNSVVIANIHMEYVQSLYKFIIACLGIVFLYAVIRYLISFKAVDEILCWFGRYTFEIYVAHALLLYVGIGTGLLRMVSTFIIAITLSLLIAVIVKKVPILNVCLYGRNRNQPFSASQSG